MEKIIISISAIADKVRRGEVANWRLLEDTKDYIMFEFQSDKWYKTVQVQITKSDLKTRITPTCTQRPLKKVRGSKDEVWDYYIAQFADLLSFGLPAELKKVKL